MIRGAAAAWWSSTIPLASQAVESTAPPPPPAQTAQAAATAHAAERQLQLKQLEEEEERNQFKLQLSEEEAEDILLLDREEEQGEGEEGEEGEEPLQQQEEVPAAEDEHSAMPTEEEGELEGQDSQPPPPPPPPPSTTSSSTTTIATTIVSGVFGDATLLGGTYDASTGHVTLVPQIVLPEVPIIQHYDSTQNYWPLHSILRQRGWAFATQALPGRVSMWISRGQVPPRMREGHQMLNSMGVSGCIGGSKSLQLECRRRIALAHGCAYESLGLQPNQYNMLKPDDCARLAAETTGKAYLSKPTFTFHGSGIKIHQNTPPAQLSKQHCGFPTIIMDYIAKPATMLGGFKFDFRTYLLVASLKPQLVFYHDGFVRKSDKPFDLNAKDLNVHITNKVSQSKDEHFFNFDVLGRQLHEELGLPLDHLQTYVVPKAKRISRFLFQSTLVQQKPPRHVPGRFHLFGIDWMLDSKGELHLLEGNGYPLVTHYPEELGLTPRIWEEMTDLILGLQTKPNEFLRDKPALTVAGAGFSYGRWQLVFNELEEEFEKARGNAYNSCKVFGGK